MRIKKFTLQQKQSFKGKSVNFDSDISILYSEENTTGKTTLMRAVLYTLGFPIPNTELVKFEDFEFGIELENKGKIYNIKRSGSLLTIDEAEYDLPTDQVSAHGFLFGTGNNEIIYNILGTIYFDQEKGWTLLNRGTIIGKIGFNIESFFRGLKGDESDDSYRLVAKIKALDKKIEQYKLILSVSEYQESINSTVEHNVDYKTYTQKLDGEILSKKMALDRVDSDISLLTEMIKKNTSFSAYITSKKLFVRDPNGGEPIRVSSDTLVDFNDLQDTNHARKATLVAERNRIKREIADLELAQDKEITFLDLPSVDEELTRKFADIQSVSSLQAKAMLEKFKKERKHLNEILINRTAKNNHWTADAYKIITDYAKELKIPSGYKIDVFTRNLKAKTGAILHKLVFIYKLAYIKLMSQKLGYNLPIFCDSPSGREVVKNTTDEVFGIIKRDFSDHQVVFASIYKYDEIFPQANIIEMNGTLFNKTSLLD